MPMTVIPSIDLRGGRVVRLQQGDYARQLSYDVDPLATARAFAAAGAQWLHIVDLDGAKAGRPLQSELILKLARDGGLKVQCGGGIREQSDIEALTAGGVDRVVIGTRALEDWDWFGRLVAQPAMVRRIVLALDARDGIVATRAWTGSSGRPAVDVARSVNGWPLAGVLYTDVARDGMMLGPNTDQTRRLVEASDIPVIASGGVGSIAHIRQLAAIGVSAVVVGRSLYEGAVDLAEAIRTAGA